ncbi:MAG: type VII secretion protein EssC [Clostridia bacterium]|nr:type VII secretion protein EssC [Clostridia bacterium]MBQ4158995.1 type VII secretion protein EssC [Clostridia bacterium]
MYTGWLTFGDSFKDVYFPDQENWNSRVIIRQEETGWECDVYISVRALDGHVYISPNAPLMWKDGGRREKELRGDSIFSMRESTSGRELSVIIKQCDRRGLCFTKYRLPKRKIIIGRSDRADVRDTGVLMSTEHGYLGLTQEGYVKYQDQSSNGTYINARKLQGNTARLKFGDVLAFPTGLKIVFLGDCLAINRTTGYLSVSLELWAPPPEKPNPADDDREIPSVYFEYQRSPRMLHKSTYEETEIEPPIPKQDDNQQPLFLQLGPSMTMVLPMLMGTMVASNGRGMISSGLVMISTSSLLAVIWGLVNRKYRKKQALLTEQRRTGMYQQYIAEIERELQKMNEDEYQRLMNTFPNAAQCALMPAERSNSLWNRMPTHPDFLEMRIGTGDVDIPCEITIPKKKLSIIDDALRNEPDRLKAKYSIINNAPVTLHFRDESVIGILGGMRAVLFVQGMLMQIAALHSYHDVRIAVLTEESTVSQWTWVRWLPHLFTSEDRELRMFAYTPSDVHDVVAHLDEVLTIRKSNASQSGGAEDEEDAKNEMPLPHYIIFCTNYKILEDEPIMRGLLTNKLGMTLVMIGKEMTHLPKECRIVLNMRSSEGMMHTYEGDTQKIDYEYPDRGLLRGFSRSMAPMRVRDVAENAAIPTLVSFLDIYNVRRVEDLELWRMWTENQTYNGLKSIIGYKAGSQPFVLDISDKYHGPHGLIAGTTGSGKSVMLETYILSLALNYSPKQVQFILIDYKGGGMADSFSHLPHLAGIIDNLQGPRIIDRALASLNGEIKRREKIFKAVKVNNINDYTRQYGDEPGMEMPHLIIIVDEFAELKSEQPEFMSELVSASRVGRSLGIHLILATQKPSNSVSDEIWANSRFHLCLRVQTRQDSMDMLKRPDAAYIKGMGRCFIQIGNDELFEQVQTSYSGLDYKPDEPRAEEIPQLLTTTGHVVKVKRPKNARVQAAVAAGVPVVEEKEDTQMTAVLRRIIEVAKEHGMEKNRRMWLPVLPSYVYLPELDMFKDACWDGKNYPNPQGDVIMMLGVADDVANQRYLPFTFNLTENHNMIIAGLAGTGKTTAVQSLVYSLCSMYDPDHMNIYLLSLTSQTLSFLTAFPQVGDIVLDGEVTETKRFLNMMIEELDRRAELFAKASTDNFIEYNNARIRKGEKPEPVIVVFVDRFMQLREMFANDEFYTSRIQLLIQEGSGRGIHFIVTAMMKNEVPMKMQPFFGGVALQQKDRSDYADCIGRRVPYEMSQIDNNFGRGMGVLNEKIYEIQFALGGKRPKHENEGFVSLENVEKYEITSEFTQKTQLTDTERAEYIREYAAELNGAWTGRRPEMIPRIPENPTFDMLAGVKGYQKAIEEPFTVPVGYDMVQGALASVNISDAPSWLVYGPKKSGVSNFLKLMTRVMKARNSDVYVLGDANWNKIAKEMNVPLYDTPEKIVEFLDMFIKKYAVTRKPLRDQAIAKGKSASRKQAAEFTQCCIVIDNAERLYTEFNNEPYKKHLIQVQGLLGEICEKAYYNFAIFMGVSSKDKTCYMNDPVRKAASMGRAIALGGRLSEFDPCNIGGELTGSARNAALPTGHGYVYKEGKLVRIVVPLAEEEDE